MLAKYSDALTEQSVITFRKQANGEDASLFGAFSLHTDLVLSLAVPRVFGITAVTLCLTRDEGETASLPLTLTDIAAGEDIWCVPLDLTALCEGEDNGLFYYAFQFARGAEILYSDTSDNLHLTLSDTPAGPFRLLVYAPGFDTPAWFRGGTMYHIFVDRFCRGSSVAPPRSDAEMNPDWENGVPSYADVPGGFVRNNEFFGGNLVGIREKLPYLQSLGVTCLYLSPIFKAYSNHKYDTGDYRTVDAMFGGEAALKDLIREAKACHIRVILDGVFNHTGDDSLYFNKYGKYPSVGAYQSTESPYYDWFCFRQHPDDYESWWGISILPKLNLKHPACRDYLVGKQDSVVSSYLKQGIGGWRLDVADELDDTFLDMLRSTAKKASGGEAILIGEVWENAADKVAYGRRRRYFRGRQLDSVMNYPFKNAVIAYLMEQDSACLARELTELYASYPKCVCDSLMNLLGTHDTERILTVLGGENKGGLPNAELAHVRMAADARVLAVARLKLASVLQYTVYGIPSVFYGDEAGMEGYHDPFCRMPYPWGHEDESLLAHYRRLGKIRQSEPVLREGLFRVLCQDGPFLAFERTGGDTRLVIAVNAGTSSCPLPFRGTDLLSGKPITEPTLPPLTAVILRAPTDADMENA